MLVLAIAPGNCLLQEFSCLTQNINEGRHKALILVSRYQRSCASLTLQAPRATLFFLSESVITQYITPSTNRIYSHIMDPFLTGDYREAGLPLDVNALTILHIVDLLHVMVHLKPTIERFMELKRQEANIPSKVSAFLSSHYFFLSQLVSSLCLFCAWLTIHT